MRTFVILGIVLLIASIGGAIWMRDFQAPAGTTHGKNGADSGTPEKVICWGYFDAETGVAGLYPKQFG
ncbi:MAG: hypothetical protein HYR84_01470, partial [Planctomycetes bacterium]|nr:hypothetical protein [Planctomycetota bacterium]